MKSSFPSEGAFRCRSISSSCPATGVGGPKYIRIRSSLRRCTAGRESMFAVEGGEMEDVLVPSRSRRVCSAASMVG